MLPSMGGHILNQQVMQGRLRPTKCLSCNSPYRLYNEAPLNSLSFLLLTSRIIQLLENETQTSTANIPKYFQE